MFPFTYAVRSILEQERQKDRKTERQKDRKTERKKERQKERKNKNCLGSFQVLWNKNCTTKNEKKL